MKLRLALLICLPALTAGISGCQREPAADPAVVALRQRLMLPAEPAGALSLEEAKAAIESDPNVVVMGRIEVDEETLRNAKEAVVVISQFTPGDDAHAQAAGHDPDDCPFCKRKKADAPLAIIQFEDEQGGLLPFDVHQLFGLRKGQVVIVRGHARLNELDMLLVSADGLYVK
jgi:hypothetical protein